MHSSKPDSQSPEKRAGHRGAPQRDPLQRTISVEFIEQPLDEALAMISTITGVTIELDESALQAAGVDRDTPITASVQNETVAALLDEILRPLNLTYRFPAVVITAEPTME